MNIGSDVVALVAVLLIVLFMWIITANALAQTHAGMDLNDRAAKAIGAPATGVHSRGLAAGKRSDDA